MDDLWELRVRLLLSIQRALLGQVTPNIRVVTATMVSDTITLRFIIDGEISDRSRQDLSVVATEVIADFATHQIEVELVRCDEPRATAEWHFDHLAYMRRE